MVLTGSEDFYKGWLGQFLFCYHNNLIKKYSLVCANSLTLDLENRCRARGPSAGRKTTGESVQNVPWPANPREALVNSWAEGREAKGKRRIWRQILISSDHSSIPLTLAFPIHPTWIAVDFRNRLKYKFGETWWMKWTGYLA